MKARDTVKGLTAERLRELLDFDPATGKFFRRVSNNQWPVGSEAAQAPTPVGYTRITISGKHYMAHRLAWLHFYGQWPENQIDHRDLDKANNRIENLRPASPSNNSANKKVMKNNVLGVKGVRLHECGKFVARIMHQQKAYHLGVFDTVEQAISARTQKAQELHGEFVRTS